MCAQVITSDDPGQPNKTLQFRLIKSFEDVSSEESATTRSCIEISQRYGVTFVLHNGSLRVVESKALLVNNTLPQPVRNDVDTISLSSDDSLLAVGKGSKVSVFETKTFCLQPSVAAARCSFIVSKSGGGISQLAWNPADNKLIAALSQDGTVILIRVLDNWSIEALTASHPGFRQVSFMARCMSWSPKGKQLVVGGTNGIVQLKLDLKEAKRIPLPTGQEPVSIHWLSTLQFLVSFQPSSGDDLKIMLLTLSKTANPTYKDYGDIFLSDDFTNAKVLSKHIPQWRLHLLGSSTSSDIIVVSHDPSQPTSDLVVQEIEDRFRAALPLDNFCRGAAIYLGCNESVIFNGEDLIACPVLVLLSQKGLVTLFRIINEGFDTIHAPVSEQLQVSKSSSAAEFGSSNIVAAAISGTPMFGNLNIVAPPAKSLFGVTTTTIAPADTGLFGAPSTTGSFFANPAISVPSVAPNINVVAPARKNLFGDPSAAPQAFGFGSSLPKLDTKDVIKKPPAFEQMVGGQSQSGGGDAPSLVLPTVSVQEQATKEIPPIKPAPKAHEYRHLLEQIKQFHTRYNNFKKLHLQQSKSQSDAIHQYFAKLDSQILTDLHKMSDFARDIVETTNGQKEEVDGLYMNMQNLFTKIEYGLIAAEKSKDSKYLLLLRAQPIDPVSMSRLTKVEKSYIYLRNQLKEARRHFYYQEQNLRPLQGTVSVDFIFQTIANHNLIIQHLNRQAQELRQRMSEQHIQLISSVGNSDVTLDDIASGISHLKLKPTKKDENNILVKQQIIYTKDKVSQLKRWAGHTLITRIPVTGGIDPYLPIAQVRKIRLNPESLEEDIVAQPIVSSVAGSQKQELPKISGGTEVNLKIDTPLSKAISFSAGQPLLSSCSGGIPGVVSQPSFVSTSSFSPPALRNKSLEQPNLAANALPISSVFINTPDKILASSPSSIGSGSFSVVSSKSSIFGLGPQTTTTSPSIFGGSSASILTTATPSFSFVSSQAPISLFSSLSSSTDSNAPQTSSIFTSAFLNPTAITAPTSRVISTSVPSSSSIFGSQLFGSKNVAVTTTTTSLFGSKPSVSLFGVPKATEPASTSMFASPKPPDNSLFGIPKEKIDIPAVDSKLANVIPVSEGIGKSESTASAVSVGQSVTTLTSTTPTSGSALFQTKTTSLFGQPSFSSSSKVSTAVTGTTTPFLGTTVAGSAFGGSLAFGSAPFFGGAIKTEGDITTTATSVSSVFGLPNPLVVTSTSLPTSQPTIKNDDVTLSASVPVATTTLSSEQHSTTKASTTSLGALLEDDSAGKEKQKSEPAVSEPSTTAAAKPEGTSALFGSTSLSTSAPSVFASVSSAPSLSGNSSAVESSSIFEAPSTTPVGTLFGSKGTTSVFGAPVTTAGIFGTPSTTVCTTTSSLFGTTSNASLFGSTAAASITTTVAPTSSLFGSPAPSNTDVFGSPATSSAPSVFGAVKTTTFGSAGAVSSNTTPSLFGSPTATSPSTLFGSAESKPAEPSIFGGGASVFGGVSISPGDAKPLFGAPATSTTTASQGIFGSPAFGSTAFGSQTATASPGLFGSPPFGTSGGSIVKPTASAFGGAPTGSVFGGPATATTTASAFGTAPASPSFGGGAVFGGSPAFGSSIKPSSFGASNIFGGAPPATGSTFGSLANSSAPTSTPAFGAAFGSPQQQPHQSTFGNATTFGGSAAFGAQAQTSPSVFGSPAFGTSGTSAFGQQQQTNSGFGGGAVFGGSPVFGSTSKTAAFGTSSTSSIFGGGSDNTGASFGNLATNQPAFGTPQGTGGFGASAQQSFGSFNSFGQTSPQPTFGGPTFGGGFSQPQQQTPQKTASFGGSSFSSWR